MKVIRSIAVLLFRFVMFMRVDEELIYVDEEREAGMESYMKNVLSSVAAISLISVICYIMMLIPVGFAV